ncbi:MAG: WhiB family transcriptional regulator [Nocardioides sp.]|nr:WhiB family transcriptional regulator [Nocardioides sp.]
MNPATAWMTNAACAAHPDLPWTTDTDELRRVPEVVVSLMLDTCETCPVRAECDAYAVEQEMTGGWWAGVDRSRDLLTEWVPVRCVFGVVEEQGALFSMGRVA